MSTLKCCRVYFSLGLLLLLVGCAGPRVMMPTPNVYIDAEHDAFADLRPPLKSTEVRLFYVTDRAPEQDEAGNLRYGYERSPSQAFGTTVVDLGADITWEELLEASRTQQRLKPVKLAVREVTEIARSPSSPLPFALVDGEIVEKPEAVAQRKRTVETFRQVLEQQLALTPRKEVFVYVHGYHNSFDDAAFAMAELWHFLGRIGVPIIYTWPAGYPGAFGYTYDRESSEFTVYHLRFMLNALASFPEVEKVNIIAHSRGTDVAVAALRELTMMARAAGIDPREKYKIHNLVLAAPDLDIQVFMQRIMGDELPASVDRFTIYTSPKDKAIGVASRLFQSPRGRLGKLSLENATDEITAAMEFGTADVAVINFDPAYSRAHEQGDTFGHSYFRDAPTVSSDVVLTLRDDLDPGSPGRPLENVGLKFWQIPPGYPSAQSE